MEKVAVFHLKTILPLARGSGSLGGVFSMPRPPDGEGFEVCAQAQSPGLTGWPRPGSDLTKAAAVMTSTRQQRCANRSSREAARTRLWGKRRGHPLPALGPAPRMRQRSLTLCGRGPHFVVTGQMVRVRRPFPSPLPSSFPSPSPCPSVFFPSPVSLPAAYPVDARFRSEAVCGRVSRLFRLRSGGGGGACASRGGVGRRVPWAVHLRVAGPRPWGRWR